MCIQTEYTWYTVLLQNISTGLELFRDDFQKKNSECDPDPPTHFHSKLRFVEFFSLQSTQVFSHYNALRYNMDSAITRSISAPNILAATG